jgi:hypothetical protein
MAEKRRQADREEGVILTEIKYIKENVEDIKKTQKEQFEKIEKCYVTKVEFDPIKRLFWLTLTLFATGIIGAIIALVVKLQ